MTMRVAIVNPVWEESVRDAEETLTRFRTLTGWADAVASAGASVTVHQRFPLTTTLTRQDLSYAFVADGGPARPARRNNDASAIAASVTAVDPDVVHVNGVVFPEWLRALRRALPQEIRMVVQDHGGWDPADASAWSRLRIRRGLAVTDSVLLSSPGHADSWRRAGVVPANVRVADVMEASTDLTPLPKCEASAASGVTGDPAVLWVGRLIPNKDPLTMLEGFARYVDERPSAALSMVFGDGTMLPEVHKRIRSDERLAVRVRVVGAVPSSLMAAYYSAADIYVSASHREGSGYAAIEAMACGAMPVLTDIPSFRVLTDDGSVGELWQKKQPQSLCEALMKASAGPRESARSLVRARFESALSWSVIGRRALGIYRDVCDR